MGCSTSHVTVMDSGGKEIVSIECPVSYTTLCFLSGAQNLVDAIGQPIDTTTRFTHNCQVIRDVASKYVKGEICAFCASEFPDDEFRFNHSFWCCATKLALKTP